jgi:hypothetical protein
MLRFRSAILMAAFLLFGIGALVIVPGTMALRAAAPVELAAESSCVLPGITVVTDAANDQSAAGAADQDLLSVSFAEPVDPIGDRLYVTMKVRGPVNPAALPPNTTWRTHFKHGAITWFVTVYSDQSSVVNFEYGQIDPTTGSNSTLGTADDGLVTADGTFEVIVSKSLVGSPAVGTNLTEIRGTVQKLVGAAGTGLLATIDRGPDQPALGAATYGSPYLVKGNASCGSARPRLLRSQAQRLRRLRQAAVAPRRFPSTCRLREWQTIGVSLQSASTGNPKRPSTAHPTAAR